MDICVSSTYKRCKICLVSDTSRNKQRLTHRARQEHDELPSQHQLEQKLVKVPEWPPPLFATVSFVSSYFPVKQHEFMCMWHTLTVRPGSDQHQT